MVLRAFAGQINGIPLFVINTGGPLNCPAVIVWPGRLHIKIDHDRLTHFRSDDGCDDIALFVLDLRCRVARELAVEVSINAFAVDSSGPQMHRFPHSMIQI